MAEIGLDRHGKLIVEKKQCKMDRGTHGFSYFTAMVEPIGATKVELSNCCSMVFAMKSFAVSVEL